MKLEIEMLFLITFASHKVFCQNITGSYLGLPPTFGYFQFQVTGRARLALMK